MGQLTPWATITASLLGLLGVSLPRVGLIYSARPCRPWFSSARPRLVGLGSRRPILVGLGSCLLVLGLSASVLVGPSSSALVLVGLGNLAHPHQPILVGPSSLPWSPRSLTLATDSSNSPNSIVSCPGRLHAVGPGSLLPVILTVLRRRDPDLLLPTSAPSMGQASQPTPRLSRVQMETPGSCLRPGCPRLSRLHPRCPRLSRHLQIPDSAPSFSSLLDLHPRLRPDRPGLPQTAPNSLLLSSPGFVPTLRTAPSPDSLHGFNGTADFPWRATLELCPQLPSMAPSRSRQPPKQPQQPHCMARVHGSTTIRTVQ